MIYSSHEYSISNYFDIFPICIHQSMMHRSMHGGIFTVKFKEIKMFLRPTHRSAYGTFFLFPMQIWLSPFDRLLVASEQRNNLTAFRKCWSYFWQLGLTFVFSSPLPNRCTWISISVVLLNTTDLFWNEGLYYTKK